MFSASTPPSTESNSPGPGNRANAAALQRHGSNSCPPKPGMTLITSTTSHVVEELFDGGDRRGRIEARSPPTPRACGSAAAVAAAPTPPRCESSSGPRPHGETPRHSGAGSEIIRWTSSGNRVTRRTASTIGTPMLRLGTKWPSMMSRWRIRALPLPTGESRPPDARSRKPEATARPMAPPRATLMLHPRPTYLAWPKAANQLLYQRGPTAQFYQAAQAASALFWGCKVLR